MEVEKRTRGHTLKIHKKGARLDCRRYSFSQRVVNNWNALPVEAVSCTTVNSFKGKIAPLTVFCPGFQKGRVPSEKGHI